MASSKEKAVGLKDAYVAGLLDSAGPDGAAEAGAGAMQELAGKLGMEQGQQASTFIDLNDDIVLRSNDGKPHAIYAGMGKVYRDTNSPDQAYPLPGGHGREDIDYLTPGLRRHGAQMLHNYGRESVYGRP